LEAAGAIKKRRAFKIQHKAEREEDPGKMKKYMAQSRYAARSYQAKKLSGKVESEGVLVLQGKLIFEVYKMGKPLRGKIFNPLRKEGLLNLS
jgi:hypothetical protein